MPKNFSSTISYKNSYSFNRDTDGAEDDMTTEEVTAAQWAELKNEGIDLSLIGSIVTVEVAPDQVANEAPDEATTAPVDVPQDTSTSWMNATYVEE